MTTTERQWRTARVLTATSFGVVGGSIAWYGLFQHSALMAFCVGLGWGVTMWFVWPRVAGREESVLRSTLAWVAIGLVSFPVAAVGTLIGFTIQDLVAANPNRPQLPVQHRLRHAAEWIMMWSYFYPARFGWLTAGVGAMAGLVTGVTHRVWRSINNRRLLAAVDDETQRQEVHRELATIGRPWESWQASLLALTILLGLSSIPLVIQAQRAPPDQRRSVITPKRTTFQGEKLIRSRRRAGETK